MFQIPKRPAAGDHRFAGKVVFRWRRAGGPFESPGIPWIRARLFAFEVRPPQVVNEDHGGNALDEAADGDDHVPGIPPTPRLIGVDTARHAQKSWYVHEVETYVETDQEQPEVPFAQPLIQHLAGHLGVPVVEPSKEAEDDGSYQNVVKVCDDEIGVMQLPIPGRN